MTPRCPPSIESTGQGDDLMVVRPQNGPRVAMSKLFDRKSKIGQQPRHVTCTADMLDRFGPEPAYTADAPFAANPVVKALRRFEMVVKPSQEFVQLDHTPIVFTDIVGATRLGCGLKNTGVAPGVVATDERRESNVHRRGLRRTRAFFLWSGDKRRKRRSGYASEPPMLAYTGLKKNICLDPAPNESGLPKAPNLTNSSVGNSVSTTGATSQ